MFWIHFLKYTKKLRERGRMNFVFTKKERFYTALIYKYILGLEEEQELNKQTGRFVNLICLL